MAFFKTLYSKLSHFGSVDFTSESYEDTLIPPPLQNNYNLFVVTTCNWLLLFSVLVMLPHTSAMSVVVAIYVVMAMDQGELITVLRAPTVLLVFLLLSGRHHLLVIVLSATVHRLVRDPLIVRIIVGYFYEPVYTRRGVDLKLNRARPIRLNNNAPRNLNNWSAFSSPTRAQKWYSTHPDGKIPFEVVEYLIANGLVEIEMDYSVHLSARDSPSYYVNQLGRWEPTQRNSFKPKPSFISITREDWNSKGTTKRIQKRLVDLPCSRHSVQNTQLTTATPLTRLDGTIIMQGEGSSDGLTVEDRIDQEAVKFEARTLARKKAADELKRIKIERANEKASKSKEKTAKSKTSRRNRRGSRSSSDSDSSSDRKPKANPKVKKRTKLLKVKNPIQPTKAPEKTVLVADLEPKRLDEVPTKAGIVRFDLDKSAPPENGFMDTDMTIGELEYRFANMATETPEPNETTTPDHSPGTSLRGDEDEPWQPEDEMADDYNGGLAGITIRPSNYMLAMNPTNREAVNIAHIDTQYNSDGVQRKIFMPPDEWQEVMTGRIADEATVQSPIAMLFLSPNVAGTMGLGPDMSFTTDQIKHLVDENLISAYTDEGLYDPEGLLDTGYKPTGVSLYFGPDYVTVNVPMACLNKTTREFRLPNEYYG